LLPATTGTLDGTLSADADGEPLTFLWEQIYGPSEINFSDKTLASPGISNLESGIYQCLLKVSDGVYSSQSEVLVIVTDQSNLVPYVSVTSPATNSSFFEGKSISISANASDLDGSISLVEFFSGEEKIGQSTASPFSFTWSEGIIGEHSVTAKATDDAGAQTISTPINIIITPSPPCDGGPSNKDYTYRFTPDKSNPFLTFIPGTAAAGNPTCILYYGTNATGPFPGVNVKPNVPYRITASEGSVVYFYYTYSFTGGERNTSANMHTYEIGSCNGSDPFLTVLTSTLSVAAGANSKANFTIDTNIECVVSSDQSWLSYNPEIINSYSTITITAEANPTAVKRTAAITISGSGVTARKIVVTQAAGTTAIEEVSGEGISIYPIPAGDLIYVNGLKDQSTARIFDICGNLMFTKNLNAFSNKIDLSSLSKGVYFIKLHMDNSVVVKQFVKY